MLLEKLQVRVVFNICKKSLMSLPLKTTTRKFDRSERTQNYCRNHWLWGTRSV